MRKSMKRRRKAKKSRKTIPKMLESLKNLKPRIGITPTGSVFKSIKDYNRKNNKKAIEDGL